MTIPTLTRAEVRAVSRALRAAGLALPRVGWSTFFHNLARRRVVTWPDPYVRAVSHDARGYFLIRGTTPLRALLLAVALAFTIGCAHVPPGFALGDDGEPYPTTCATCRTDGECEALCPEVEP